MNSAGNACEKCTVTNCNKCATEVGKCTECAMDGNTTLYGEMCKKAMTKADCKEG